MRTWRKVYASILDSNSLFPLSSEAIVLLMFLIVAQDDTGYYPWTPAKVRRLTASRPSWTLKETTAYAQELAQADILSWQDGGIVLRRGRELNGRLRHDRAEELYPRPSVDTPLLPDIPAVNQRLSTDIPEAAPEKSKRRVRVEEEEEKKASPSSSLALPDPIIPLARSQTLADYLVVLRARYPLLDFDAELEKCSLWWLEEKGKTPGKLAIRNWLEKAEKDRASPPVNGTQVRYNKGTVDPDDPDKYWKGRYGKLARS